MLSRTRQFSEGSTLINVSLHIDYDSLENIHKVHSVPWESEQAFRADCDVHSVQREAFRKTSNLLNSCTEASKSNSEKTQFCEHSCITSYQRQPYGGMNPPLVACLPSLQEELGFDSTSNFQPCKYSCDESYPQWLSHKLSQNTHRSREGLETWISPCVVASCSVPMTHCWVRLFSRAQCCEQTCHQ